MFIFTARLSFIITTALFLLSSCTPARSDYAIAPLTQVVAPRISSGSGTNYPVTKGLLFVTNSDVEKPYDEIQIYNVRKKDALVDVITNEVSYPQSVCLDNHRTLYVVNGYGWVSEYILGSTTPKLVITQGIVQPSFCAIDGDGNLWVTNTGAANVAEYTVGSTVPSQVISDGVPYPVGIAFDSQDNMYVANHYGGSATNVVVFSPGKTAPSRTIVDGVQWPIGIGIDLQDNLYVTNAVPGNIEEYHYGSSKPFRTLTKELNGPAAVTFTPTDRMYVSNLGFQNGGTGPPSAILDFPPHSQVPSKKIIAYPKLYQPQGTAFYPPAKP